LAVALVGAGAVATAFGVLLQRAGHRVVLATGREPSRIRAERHLPSAPFVPWTDAARVTDALHDADLVLIGVPDDAIRINNKAFPELDISYFFTPNIASELILTYPQQQDVTVGGAKIGSFRHLPPILTLQYHFTPESRFKPYLGAGINYTRISSVNLQVPGVGPLDLSKNSFGPALQAGFDYRLSERVYFNVDIKKTWISADVKFNGQTISKVHVDPWLVGVGLGYRF